MKSFRQTVTDRIRIQIIKAIAVGCFVTIAFIVKVQWQGNIEAISDVDKIIIIGLFFGGEASAVRAILKYRKALKTPEALDALHIKETDERNRIIILKTCRSTMNLTITLLAFAGVIASFFSHTLLMTIGIILISILVLYAALAAYYSRKV